MAKVNKFQRFIYGLLSGFLRPWEQEINLKYLELYDGKFQQLKQLRQSEIEQSEAKIEELYQKLQDQAALYSMEIEKRDKRIYELEEMDSRLVEQTISLWVKEYLQDKEYWLRLFEHVLNQPFGRQLWVEAVYKQIDRLSPEERVELLYGYLKSRGVLDKKE